MIPSCWAVTLALFAATPTDAGPERVQSKGELSDFVEYWSAARVHAAGGNPYSAAELLPHQRVATDDPELSRALMLWTPPWTLPLYQPFGHIDDPRTAHALWLNLQRAAVLVSAVLVWLVSFRSNVASLPIRLILLLVPVAIVLRFAPYWWLLVYGQASGLVLLGVAGFLVLRQRGYPVAAGVLVSLTAMKPHLLALFGLALILDATTSREGRRALFGGVAALVVCSLLTMVPNPHVFADFAESMTRPPSHEQPSVTQWAVPLLSYELRVWLRPQKDMFWIQFLPILAGAVGTLLYWWKRRKSWDWTTETPRLVLASVVLAPYGTWIFDLVVLVVPVVALFARVVAARAWLALAVAVAGHLSIYRFASALTDLHDSIWLSPAVLAWYLAVAWLLSRFPTRPAGTP